MEIVRKIFTIPPSTDPDDTRRKKVLNTLLVSILVATTLGLIVVVILDAFRAGFTQEELQLIYVSGPLLIGITAIIFFINRRSGRWASLIFLLFLLAVIAASDTPAEVSNGRTLVAFAIPIAISSLLLAPPSSFLFAALSSIEISLIASSVGIAPNVTAIIGFFVLAVVSWLSSRSLEEALRELRATNANLDLLVQERTKELAESLAREQFEAGRSKAILESIADGVIVFDPRGNATEANPSIVRLLEIPYEGIIGCTINDLTSLKALDAKNRGLLAGLLTDTKQPTSSHRITWEQKTLSVTAAQVTGPDGKLIGTVAVFRDVTKEAEIEKMKSAFLAIVSHELRTPLNAILGYAEMLKEAIYGPVNEKQGKASERIMTNARRLLDIVSDLLDQAQIEAGKLTIQMSPLKPIELLENLHGVMDKLAGDKNLALTSELDSKLPMQLNGDAARLQQILVNLVNNAIKFTEEGSVHVRLFQADQTHWGMEVLDTGVGIPEAELKHIFDAFHQVDGTVTRAHGGFGLGLSIVKQLANLMSGDITVKSKMGTGSVFTVSLPLVVSERK